MKSDQPSTLRTKSTRSTKKPDICEYRNVQLMPGRDNLYQAEVKDKAGTWHKISCIGGDDAAARLEIIAKTAAHYGKRVVNG